MIGDNQYELAFLRCPAVDDISDSEVVQAMLANDLAAVRMRQRGYLRRDVVATMVNDAKADAAAVDVGVEVAELVPALKAFAWVLATSAGEVLQGQLLPYFGASLALDGKALQVAGTQAFAACLRHRASDVLEALKASLPDRRIAHRVQRLAQRQEGPLRVLHVLAKPCLHF